MSDDRQCPETDPHPEHHWTTMLGEHFYCDGVLGEYVAAFVDDGDASLVDHDKEDLDRETTIHPSQTEQGWSDDLWGDK